jgi:hypothetical protein
MGALAPPFPPPNAVIPKAVVFDPLELSPPPPPIITGYEVAVIEHVGLYANPPAPPPPD